jgi:phosphonate metabolism protein PhnN/1,5-bisphosphokinase (PRPP-forming)
MDPMKPSEAAGALVLVVGPSGSGKDTLMAYARTALAGDARFHFVRRIVTRASDGAGEDHDTLLIHEFEAAERAGELMLTWRAHGLAYGLPRASLKLAGEGRIVVANASRAIVKAARVAAPRLAVLHVTASPEILARRLAGRGREDARSLAERLKREAPVLAGPDIVEIRNEGTIAEAGERMVAALRAVLDHRPG